ncbi:Acg family FMN-binding oxidoreductase [Nocardia inohanensis]|uniref:Acg family FMN-binding oxidoreductase n=1 Tax=Nocardia inohanensis TaxID=209246 RepID=UPI00082C3EC7|nr:hypothetical protein [Nocardia inohanensis]
MTAMTPSADEMPDRRTVLAAIRSAARAPSVHNTQPWRLVLEGKTLHLYTDPDRLLTAADPHGRQLIISCGAMLHHIRTAFGALGWHTDTVRLPNLLEPGHLAEITFRPWENPPPGLSARAAAIDRRRTDRLPLDPPRDWAALAPRLRMLASPHYLELDTLDDSVRARLAAASEHTAVLRRHDMMYQAEIGWWTGHSGSPEGVPAEALVSDAEFARVGVGRAFPAAPHSARRAGTEDHAVLAVLSSEGDSLEQWLHTGEALSAVLLECTVAGEASCALTHITELPASRTLLAALVPAGRHPQMVIRIGHPPTPETGAPTPRRPLADILTFR